MKTVQLPLQKFGFIVATRVLLGVGIGLLAGGALRPSRRRWLGRTLVVLGALTTIPAARTLSGSIRRRRGFLFAA
jgi:hypothetical protein